MARPRAGVNSLEVGLRLAGALAERTSPQALKDLAVSAGMSPPKAHRYLVSLIRAGLAEQDRESGRYRLGPLALHFGLAAFRALDVLKFGTEVIADLRATIDETVVIAIWGNHGPVVARWEETSRPIATNVRAGWVMPLTNSATGRLFAAYLPAKLTADLLTKELSQSRISTKEFMARLAHIRTSGLSAVEEELMPGVVAIAAPVFDHEGGMVAAICAVGATSAMDVSLHGRVAATVKQAAQRLSQRLGAPASGVSAQPEEARFSKSSQRNKAREVA